MSHTPGQTPRVLPVVIIVNVRSTFRLARTIAREGLYIVDFVDRPAIVLNNVPSRLVLNDASNRAASLLGHQRPLKSTPWSDQMLHQLRRALEIERRLPRRAKDRRRSCFACLLRPHPRPARYRQNPALRLRSSIINLVDIKAGHLLDSIINLNGARPARGY
jgi:hypothetical protein